MRQAEIDKRNILIDYAKRFGPRIFIETGTYKGDTVKAMLVSGCFDEIHTIDIYEDRVEHSRKRFKTFGHVHCWHGDSATVLPTILEDVHAPALFWLDAHHSGKQIARRKGLIETPIAAELQAVLAHECSDRHVILIDDARYYEEFGRQYDNYPVTDELRKMVAEKLPKATFNIDRDIIRIHYANDATAG